MHATRIMPLLCSLSLLGCDTYLVPNEDGGLSDMKCPPPPDMTVPPAKCDAAKGLAGDNLLCVNFAQVQMLSSLAGWDFTCTGGASWTTKNGMLQVDNFSNFMSSCTFTMPALSAADYDRYSSFSLSVVHTVDVNAMRQNANIYLGVDQQNQLIWSMVGTYPRQRNVFEIAKTALPNGGSNRYQPLFKINSTVPVGGTATGWLIESIAINGHKP